MTRNSLHACNNGRRFLAALLAAALLLTAAASCAFNDGDSPKPAAEWSSAFEDEATGKALESFIDRFTKWYAAVPRGAWQYDHSKAADGSGNILACIAAPAPCVDWTLFSDVNRDDRFIERADDPRGWAADTISYYIYDAETVEYIAREIFNVSRDDIEKLVELGEKSRIFYRQGGNYYTLLDENLDSLVDAKMVSVRNNGGRYTVKFVIRGISEQNEEGVVRVIYRECTAEMALKTLDDGQYWSMYSFDSAET